ncbi:4Fe-4S domain-containing protein [Actinoalloteichus spitiensis]|uniref:4Fe-4S domain-containing protein n=1 Tax=Actinoalloteichus spitiensis TaxID=252394 RepID=UPI0003746A24
MSAEEHPASGGAPGGGAEAGALRVAVVADRCVASGQCAQLAPGVFDQGESDGVVVLLDPEPPVGRAAAVRLAEEMCPVGAIRLARRGEADRDDGEERVGGGFRGN